MSGGFVPAAVRGTRIGGMIHGCDWYTTFCALAGVDATDRRAAAAEPALPPVDGVNVWPLISGENSTSPRSEVHVSSGALVSGTWKLLVGKVKDAGWTGPVFPNSSTSASVNQALDCGKDGCLFDVVNDPTEQADVAAANPDVVTRLNARLAELNKGNYGNSDKGVDDCPAGTAGPCACWKAAHIYGGFFGPFQL